jgi:hypothetical protein
MHLVGRFLMASVLAAVLATPAFAKGFLAEGRFEGLSESGEKIFVTLALVNLEGTTSVITDCNIDDTCQLAPRATLRDTATGKSVPILDLLVIEESWTDRTWTNHYGYVGPRRVIRPSFTLRSYLGTDHLELLRGERSIPLTRVR